MRPTLIAAVAAGLAAAGIAAGVAVAQPASITWHENFSSSAPENNPTINVGEAVTWNVTEGGHNIDIYKGPETFKSTSGTDKSGTQFSHTFNKAGKYTFVCDYHSNMTGTVTVVDPAPQPGPQPQPQPKPGGGTPQPVTGGGAQTSEPGEAGAAGPAGSAAGATDGAAPSVRRLSLRRGTLRVRLSEPARLTIRYREVGARKVGKKVVTGRKGINAIRLSRWMRSGRYNVSVVATDAAGNVSRALRVTVRR